MLDDASYSDSVGPPAGGVPADRGEVRALSRAGGESGSSVGPGEVQAERPPESLPLPADLSSALSTALLGRSERSKDPSLYCCTSELARARVGCVAACRSLRSSHCAS